MPTDKKKIILPVTEESAGRTSKPSAHALCEQLGYLLNTDEAKHQLYIDGLKKWNDSAYSHPKVSAVLQYMERGTLQKDLIDAGISIANEKDFVCWRIIGLEADSGPVWTDLSLMHAYTAYYIANQQSDNGLCMLTGEEMPITWNHLKGVFPLHGNAKIISANDAQNFTYRGRFDTPSESASVGLISSQKAHNALKWLISTQGVICGERAFVCWNPRGLEVPKATGPALAESDETQEYSDYPSYRNDLKKKLDGLLLDWKVNDQVVVAAFDAASKGRLAVTYYNELLGSDFMQRLVRWDEACCWKDAYHGISSPSLYQIATFAFGTQRGENAKVETDKKLLASQIQRLLFCRVDQAAIPSDIMMALTSKAKNLLSYTEFNRNKLLFTACAVIRKFYIDHYKEEISLALEPKRKDRSYQWGRLLAVMEKIERDTYDSSENREPNAIRMQSVFVQRPGYATQIVMERLKSVYYPRLPVSFRIFYDLLIQEIMEELSQFDAAEYGKPLTETFILGYYLQKSALYTKKNQEETEEN